MFEHIQQVASLNMVDNLFERDSADLPEPIVLLYVPVEHNHGLIIAQCVHNGNGWAACFLISAI